MFLNTFRKMVVYMRQTRNNQSGFSMPDTALALALLIPFMMVIIDFSNVGFNWISLQSSVNHSIRKAVMSTDALNAATTEFCNSAQKFNIAKDGCPSSTLTVTPSIIDKSTPNYPQLGQWLILETGKKVRVSPIFKLLLGLASEEIQIQASGEARLEYEQTA